MKPGYMQTEVGVIPEDWEVQTLKNLNLDISDGNYSSKYPSASDFRPYGVPFIRANNIRNMGILDDDMRFISPDQHGALLKGHLKKNDVLVTTRGEIGQIALVPDRHVDSNINAQLVRISTSNRSIDHLFFAYSLLSKASQEQLSSLQTGSALKQLPVGRLTQLRLVLAPLPEQRAIAEVLSDVDGLLGSLDRLIAKKRDLKQATMQQLLTGRTRLPGFHGEWEVKRLGSVGKCLRGVSYRGDSDLGTHDTPHTKRLFRSNNVQDAIIVTDEVQFVNAARVASRQILRKDDILICMANGSKALVGKAAIFRVNDGHEYTFGAFMGCFRNSSSEANSAFLFYLFLTAQYRYYINNLLAGSSINNLRPSSIESLEFSMPPLPEQIAIATVLSELDAELSMMEVRRNKTRAIKQAIMQELLTGRTRLV